MTGTNSIVHPFVDRGSTRFTMKLIYLPYTCWLNWFTGNSHPFVCSLFPDKPLRRICIGIFYFLHNYSLVLKVKYLQHVRNAKWFSIWVHSIASICSISQKKALLLLCYISILSSLILYTTQFVVSARRCAHNSSFKPFSLWPKFALKMWITNFVPLDSYLKALSYDVNFMVMINIIIYEILKIKVWCWQEKNRTLHFENDGVIL